MRKTFVWALMAIMAVAGSAYAVGGQNIAANATFATGAPTSTNNDDTCDIGVAPAATLLVPYFEVDLTNNQNTNTLWTITNVSNLPQIAHVTIWTDRSFPVLDFNIFLTGYDVQSISMFDIIANGVIAPPDGTTSDEDDNPPGQRSADNDANPLLDITNCDNLAVNIPASLLADLRTALTTGRYSTCGTTLIGNNQADGRARGYVTIDVAESCSTDLPTDPNYYLTEILFDNVLIGDYQQVDRTNNFANGNPLVHIRAIPEGGDVGTTGTPGFETNFDRTFYSRYQPLGGVADRRQPLPSTFAARWITGGTGAFNTSFKIWREGVTGPTLTCSQYTNNASLAITELVRFDEDENPTTFTPDVIISPVPPGGVSLPETSNTPVSNTSIFPPNPGGDIAGWMYLNLDHGSPAGAIDPLIASQNWVIVSMGAEGRFAVDFDAAWLGNGCSPVAPVTAEDGSDPVIGPADNVTLDF
jgi:hypothetical protein